MSVLIAPDLLADVLTAIGRDTSTRVRIADIVEVGGGSISRAFRLQTDQGRYFLKQNNTAHHALFVAEADGLAALARCASIRTPRVVAAGICGKHAYLLLEHIDLHPLAGGGAGRRAGHTLADLHRMTEPRFGWARDNFIGSTPQPNAEDADWPHFFAHRRLGPQLDLARRHSIQRRIIADGERLLEKLPVLFAGHAPRPSLLHGDLWSGNAALDEAGTLTLFDPAVHFGDRECDLAMMHLFGGFPADLFAAYAEVWPLSEGFPQRRTLYQLYHVLNHLNLFGAGYQAQAERMLGSLLAEIG